jgi:surfactin synthase thioesterase subunit
VLAIVEELRLDDYMLYGISYGTLLATLVASRAEERGLPLPKAIVLEGVLGMAFDAERPTEAAFAAASAP